MTGPGGSPSGVWVPARTPGVRKQYNRLSLATGALIGRNQRSEHGALNDVGVWDSRKGVKGAQGAF